MRLNKCFCLLRSYFALASLLASLPFSMLLLSKVEAQAVAPLGATAVIKNESLKWEPFPIPGHTGKLEAAFLNRDLSQGPIVAMMKMAPGSRIPAHFHKKASETFYVLDGDFINKGVAYKKGAFFIVKPGDVHGPHSTKTGTTLMFMQSTEVDPSDFFIAETDPAFKK
jgi:quercetin dioxygenase-like cupin family protein